MRQAPPGGRGGRNPRPEGEAVQRQAAEAAGHSGHPNPRNPAPPTDPDHPPAAAAPGGGGGAVCRVRLGRPPAASIPRRAVRTPRARRQRRVDRWPRHTRAPEVTEAAVRRPARAAIPGPAIPAEASSVGLRGESVAAAFALSRNPIPAIVALDEIGVKGPEGIVQAPAARHTWTQHHRPRAKVRTRRWRSTAPSSATTKENPASDPFPPAEQEAAEDQHGVRAGVGQDRVDGGLPGRCAVREPGRRG